jgi:NADH-quinone oxidoreductase subunit M
MTLAIMICILLAGGVLSWVLSAWKISVGKWVALAAVLIDFGIIISLWSQQAQTPLLTSNTWFINYQANWIPAFGISFHLGLDGLSLILLLLTFFLGILGMKLKNAQAFIILTSYGLWQESPAYL